VRVTSLAKHLYSIDKSLEIHIWCEKWQLDTCINDNRDYNDLNFHFGLLDPGVSWSLDPIIYDDGRLINWESRVKNEGLILNADIVISDNLVGALNIRSDTVLMGSFLWSDILEQAYHSRSAIQKFVEWERGLLEKHNPQMLCLSDLAMPGVLNRTNAVPLPWMCTDYNPTNLTKSKKPRVSFQIGLTEAMKNWAVSVLPSLTSFPNYEICLPEYLMKYVPPGNRDNVRLFNFTQDDYDSCSLAICRPGVGTLTACVESGMPMILVYEEENAEMGHNAECIQKLGLGFDMGFEWDETEIIQTVKKLLNPHIYRRTKSRIQSSKKDGLKIASDWILDKVYNQ
jgi:hypothetical protein